MPELNSALCVREWGNDNNFGVIVVPSGGRTHYRDVINETLVAMMACVHYVKFELISSVNISMCKHIVSLFCETNINMWALVCDAVIKIDLSNIRILYICRY